MPVPLRWSVGAGVAGGDAVVVRIGGDLDLPTAPLLRIALLKMLAAQPAAVLVDLAAMTLSDRYALTVFSAVTRQAAMWPSIPVLLCAPSPAVAAALARGGYRRLVVHPSVATAVASLDGGRASPPSLSDELLPLRGAARHARDMATDACVRWELPQLVWPASLVASELVSNAVQHARTMVSLQFAVRMRDLLIAARDGSAEVPVLRSAGAGRPSGGRGLKLVESLARRWGSLPTDGGKVVWAALAVDRPGPV